MFNCGFNILCSVHTQKNKKLDNYHFDLSFLTHIEVQITGILSKQLTVSNGSNNSLFGHAHTLWLMLFSKKRDRRFVLTQPLVLCIMIHDIQFLLITNHLVQ